MTMIKKTYARHRSISSRPDELPAKRRRVENDNSPRDASTRDGTKEDQSRSPSPALLRLDIPSGSPAISPTPSSSPPLLTAQEPKPDPESEHHPKSPLPLNHGNANIQPKPKSSIPPKRRKLTQLTLDLGQPWDKQCTDCGMTYRPSNAEDRETHRKYHSNNFSDIVLPKAFLQILGRGHIASRNPSGGGRIVKITAADVRKKGGGIKAKHVDEVLKYVEEQLGGVGIPAAQLWGKGDGMGKGKYVIFLYLVEERCLGVCVGQSIERARRVMALPEKAGNDSSTVKDEKSIIASDEEFPASLGISRIWTSKRHRREGIARRLLDTAIENFEFAVTVPKDRVAFSQPTNSGARLARAWFGKEDGWLVYAE